MKKLFATILNSFCLHNNESLVRFERPVKWRSAFTCFIQRSFLFFLISCSFSPLNYFSFQLFFSPLQKKINYSSSFFFIVLSSHLLFNFLLFLRFFVFCWLSLIPLCILFFKCYPCVVFSIHYHNNNINNGIKVNFLIVLNCPYDGWEKNV